MREGKRQLLAGVAIEATGVGLSTYALSDPKRAPLCALATAISMYGIVTKGRAANKNGTIWRTALDEKISDLGVHTAQVEATLVDAGFTAEDIHLPSLMNEIYLTELKYPQLQSVRRILIPLSSAASMAAYGDYLLAGVVAGIGLASIPIGKAFYRESNVYRAAKVRVAQAAKHAPFLEKLDKNMSI